MVFCPVVFLERDARAAGRGLWANKAPVPPWEWRASEKGRKRVPAAADIAATTPHYVPKSFKATGSAQG
jgi:hypothetical protein